MITKEARMSGHDRTVAHAGSTLTRIAAYPFQPRRYKKTWEPFDPVPCKHGTPWTECLVCSPRGQR